MTALYIPRPSKGFPLALAMEWVECGISLIPIRTNGSKAPNVRTWGRYQKEAPTPKELQGFFKSRRVGAAIICGAVSLNYECIDFDERAMIAKFYAELTKRGGSELFRRLTMVKTPRGGLHLIYRCEEPIGGSEKLARGRGVDESTGELKVKTLIETKGEGGYFIAAGSPASCHPTGKTYRLVKGIYERPALITAAERSLLLDTARSLNEVTAASAPSRPPADFHNNKAEPGDYIGQALGWLSADDRGVWIRVGMALKDAGISFAVFDSWSSTSSKYVSTQDTRRAWDSFRERANGVTVRTIYKWARSNGWKPAR